MVKKWPCLISCVLNSFIAGLLMVWVARYCGVNKWLFIMDGLFLLCCVLTGVFVLKLDLDKLLLKFEISGAERCDKRVLLTGLIAALGIVVFVMVMVMIYFFRGVKMESWEWVRFVVLPTLSLAHLAVSGGSYLAWQYFKNYA